jgi:hypothetical protein
MDPLGGVAWSLVAHLPRLWKIYEEKLHSVEADNGSARMHRYLVENIVAANL